MVRALAVVVVLAALAPPPARAQCDPTGLNPNQVFSREVDAEIKIRDLQAIQRQIEAEHHILMIYPGGVALVSSEQAGTIFSHGILLGAMHPDSVLPSVRGLRAATTLYLRETIVPELESARQCLQRLKGQLPTPPATPRSAASSDIDWPAPMDWLEVRGAVRGTWVAECRDYRRTGPYRLEFHGDGKIAGAFEDDSYRYPITGTIAADGTARGEARPAGAANMPFLKWTANFERIGVDLAMRSHTLDPSPAAGTLLIDCKPGYMRQEDRRAVPA